MSFPSIKPVICGKRIDLNNIGEEMCGPLQYFTLPRPIYTVDVKTKYLPLLFPLDMILGGGGVFVFEKVMQRICSVWQGKLIGWGIGLNEHGVTALGSYPDYVERFHLLGVRDHGTGQRWVPCVSCLHPEFQRKREPRHELVKYHHRHFELPIDVDVPAMSHQQTDMRSVLDFLGSGNTVITNTYHGMYWATLLGRKVIAVPFSSKFYGMKHPPVLTQPDCWRARIKQATVYPEALEESIAANLAFSRDVADLLGTRLTRL